MDYWIAQGSKKQILEEVSGLSAYQNLKYLV